MVNTQESEFAKLRPCRKCGRYIIAAISGAIPVETGPEPLSIHQEIAALLTGKTTYDVMAFGRHYYLSWRCVTRMKGERTYPVVAEHTCTPGDPRSPPGPSIELLTIPRIHLPGDPPF